MIIIYQKTRNDTIAKILWCKQIPMKRTNKMRNELQMAGKENEKIWSFVVVVFALFFAGIISRLMVACWCSIFESNLLRRINDTRIKYKNKKWICKMTRRSNKRSIGSSSICNLRFLSSLNCTLIVSLCTLLWKSNIVVESVAPHFGHMVKLSNCLRFTYYNGTTSSCKE